MTISRNKGLSLLETLFVIGILALILAFGLGPFDAIKERQALNKVSEDIEKMLQNAKTMTVSSEGGYNYGVHFETSSITLFAGSIYSSSDPDNVTIMLGSSVIISEINLVGGGSNVVFNKITGDTNTNGTIKISHTENPSRYKVTTIFPIGTFITD